MGSMRAAVAPPYYFYSDTDTDWGSDRCIVALDVPTYADAMRIVAQLDGTATFYKVGLELFASGDGMRLVNTLTARGLQVFVDLKLFDVPQTVARATAQVAASGARFLTVHGNDTIMQAAVAAAAGSELSILAVTVLTSMDEADARDLGFAANISQVAQARAARAMQLGCAGVVCSGWEVQTLRQAHARATLVTPGIRLQSAASADDQKRVATPRAVIAAGGDYLVVGRPITTADNPRAQFQTILAEIQNAATPAASAAEPPATYRPA